MYIHLMEAAIRKSEADLAKQSARENIAPSNTASAPGIQRKHGTAVESDRKPTDNKQLKLSLIHISEPTRPY